jgi:hypothetical protein
MAKDNNDDLRIFESAIPLSPRDKIASQIKAIDWLQLIDTGWGSVHISIQAGQPALVQWENSLKMNCENPVKPI